MCPEIVGVSGTWAAFSVPEGPYEQLMGDAIPASVRASVTTCEVPLAKTYSLAECVATGPES